MVSACFEISENIIMKTPIKERAIPAIFFFDRVSCKNKVDRIAMKITLVLIRTEAVGAFVK